jgi:hypothetical protein
VHFWHKICNTDELSFERVNSLLGQTDSSSIIIIYSKLWVFNQIHCIFSITNACTLSSMILSAVQAQKVNNAYKGTVLLKK